ncbi:putative polyphosphoinositide binding protein [Cardiosporidium cionae]|uniref:Polyphosphoinositide binding protein n=1 Tax=Cardiosporidium cionae TaxID=476202 RepID=A0ABQ7JAB9_9APIC|nr:putative polyphosphoinositide binding protein [Cardiosporidium cionae]|eukprot:KAF8820952.1 putative polyphosphoinositide binding protein [Cardiosporidium cionae]
MASNMVEDVSFPVDLELAARFDEIDSRDALPEVVKNFIPPPEAIVWKFDGEQSIRLIFGDLPLDRFEETKLHNLFIELRKTNFPLKGTCFEGHDYLLRFLQGNEWDVPRCIEDMKRHLEWAKITFPLPLDVIDRSLKEGYCYISGRDYYLRPVFIIRCVTLQNCAMKEALDVVIYWLEYIKQKMLVKNRIDQWRVIVDLGGCTLTHFPISTMKEVALCFEISEDVSVK